MAKSKNCPSVYEILTHQYLPQKLQEQRFTIDLQPSDFEENLLENLLLSE